MPPQQTPPTTQPPVEPSQLPLSPQPLQPPGEPHAGHSTVILQWLTYAFWGWTVLALSILTSMVIANFINQTDTENFTPYGIAAVLVLLPISYICDVFYSKKEPSKKTGAEMLVLVIHAVIFALFGAGALIVAVFALVSLFTSKSDSSGSTITLISALIIAVYYALTLLRTLSPPGLPWIRRSYKLIMLGTIGFMVILAIVGPVSKERTLRDDKLIEQNISQVQTSVDGYTRTNKKLPASLAALGLSGDAKQLVDRNLVTFKPVGLVADQQNTKAAGAYRYELCVNYKKQTKGYQPYNNYDYSTDEYKTSLSAYNHPAGNVCYKLQVANY